MLVMWSHTLASWITHFKLVSSLINMADENAPQTAKESNLKRFLNRLKKVFRRCTPPSHYPLKFASS